MFDTDVFVIGGGPAGLAAAIAARRMGFRVVVADGNHPPIDKACGEGLMPDCRTAAAKIGIQIPSSHGVEFRGIRFHGAGRSVDASFPHGCALGVRRVVLHDLLVAAATGAGAELRWDTPVMGIQDGAVLLRHSTVRPRWIIGADGAASRVRRWAGLDKFARNSRRYAYRRHFAVAPWTDCMEIYWGEGCQFYITPVAAGEMCVALISRSPGLRMEEALAGFPVLQSRLPNAEVSSRERGAVTATLRLRRVTRGNVALIGDASGSVDAVTGEGLCLTFRQADLLAGAIARGDLSSYQSIHRRLAIRPNLMAEMMLLMDRSMWLRGRALHALASKPAIFQRLLAMHVGALSLPRFAATSAELGWRVIVGQ
jgi:flavin-dependent dehydrogenase